MAGKDPKIEHIRSIPIFSACGPNDLQRIAQLVDEVDIADGQVIMREGEPASEMYIVVEGKARADKDGRTLFTFGPGAVCASANRLVNSLSVILPMTSTTCRCSSGTMALAPPKASSESSVTRMPI